MFVWPAGSCLAMVAVPVLAIISFYVSPCSSPSQAEMCGAVANPAFILTNNAANSKERTNGRY